MTVRAVRRSRAAPRTRGVAERVAAVAAQLHERGWALATSGNVSAVLSRRPLRLAVTPSGVPKDSIRARDVLVVDARGRLAPANARERGSRTGGGRRAEIRRGRGTRGTSSRPSVEIRLHVAIVRARGAGAVVHTHSVWSTLLSGRAARGGDVALAGYEMLKALTGVGTHAHRERIPVIENSHDYAALAHDVEATLRRRLDAHALLLRDHGLYAWGRDLPEAMRHAEALEFLLEVEGRRRFGRVVAESHPRLPSRRRSAVPAPRRGATRGRRPRR
jgi:methylthioribulose-1-phosphate dehydratase